MFEKEWNNDKWLKNPNYREELNYNKGVIDIFKIDDDTFHYQYEFKGLEIFEIVKKEYLKIKMREQKINKLLY